MYLHDDAGNEWAEYGGGSGATLRYHAYSQGEVAPVSSTGSTGDGSAAIANYKDRLGSVIGVGDTSANGAGRAGYLPLGVDPTGTGGPPAGTAFGYAGYRFDAETGLYHVRARDYDPRLGRFLQNDPIRQDGGLNFYAHINNDPLNATDPFGLSPQESGSGLYGLLTDPHTALAGRFVLSVCLRIRLLNC